jgi:hypothetical protein
VCAQVSAAENAAEAAAHMEAALKKLDRDSQRYMIRWTKTSRRFSLWKSVEILPVVLRLHKKTLWVCVPLGQAVGSGARHQGCKGWSAVKCHVSLREVPRVSA